MNTLTGMDYKTLFDLNPLPLIVYDPQNFQILDVNDAAVKLYGYRREEMLSFKIQSLFFDNSLNEINTPEKLNGHSRIYHRRNDGTRISLTVNSADVLFDNKPARLETLVPNTPEPAADYLRLLFTSIIESSDDAIISKDMKGIILSWNKGAERIYGYKAEEVIGKNIDIIAPADKKDEIKDIMRSLALGKSYDHYETRRQTKDGKILWVSITVSPLKDISGRVIGASAIARNISKTKETMARLQENEVIFKHLIENLTEVFYVSNPAVPEILFMSNAYEEVFGESVHNIYENPGSYLDYIIEEDRRMAKRAIVRQLSGVSTDYTYRIRRADGKLKYLRERAFPVKDELGKVSRVIGIAEDITERIDSENELRKNEYRYRSIFESTAVSLWETDDSEVMAMLNELKASGVQNFRQYFKDHPEFLRDCHRKIKLIDANPRSVMLFKARNKQHLFENMAATLTDDYYDKFTSLLIVRANGGKHFETEYQLKTLSGEPIDLYSITNFPQENSPYQFTIASIVDITERKYTERALSESEQRFRVMADTAPVLIWTAGTDRMFYYFNKPWLDFRGKTLDQEIGEGWMQDIHPIDLPSFRIALNNAYNNRDEFRFEFRLIRYDGKERWLLTHGVPRYSLDGTFQGYIGSCVDITERKINEVELSKALLSEKRALRQAEGVQSKLKYLAEASYILNSSLDYKETIRSLAELLTPVVCDWFAVDLKRGERIERLVVYHKDPEKIRFAIDLQNKYAPRSDEATGVPNVIRTGRSELYAELTDEFLRRSIKDKELYMIFKRLGIKSIMIVPLAVHNKVLGAITLCTAESGKNYDEDDLRFAEDIAHRAAMAIDNASLFSQIGELNNNLEKTIRLQQQEIKYRKQIERDLRETEERFRLITENSNDFISLLDEKDIFIYANPALVRELGYSEEELIGKVSPNDLIFEEDRGLLHDYSRQPIIEIRYKKKDEGFVWVESSSLKVNYHGKVVTIRISRDITERKRIELERVKLYSQLEMQRIRIDNLIANVPGVVWEAYGEPGTPYQQLSFISKYVEKLVGYPLEIWKNQRDFWHTVTHPDDAEHSIANSQLQYRENRSLIDRFRWIAKDGRILWIESQSTCICDADGRVIGLRGVNIDITEQIKFEQQLSASLKEKEILLKEIHHRVKNNMQVISSLLSLQSKTIPDKHTQEIFDESRNRIKSMALIHEKLYQSKDLFRIDFNSYVRDLLDNLRISYGLKEKNIETKVDIENVSFDINSAISLGLIINELASNAYKHAFTEMDSGEIFISIHKVPVEKIAVPENDLNSNEINIVRTGGIAAAPKDDNHPVSRYVLIVKDNGVGMPDEDNMPTDSLGLQLVETLIEQLDGTFETKSDNGTSVHISFNI